MPRHKHVNFQAGSLAPSGTAHYELCSGDTLESLWQQHLGSLLLDGQHGAAAQTARKLFNWHLANLEFANACGCPSALARVS